MGKKYIVFVDDINVPLQGQFGVKPPIEFLRQWIDHKQFYDRKDSSKIELVDSVSRYLLFKLFNK